MLINLKQEVSPNIDKFLNLLINDLITEPIAYILKEKEF